MFKETKIKKTITLSGKGLLNVISIVLVLLLMYVFLSVPSYASTYDHTYKWYYENTTISKKICTIRVKLYGRKYNKKEKITTFKTKVYWSWDAATDTSKHSESKFDTICIAASSGSKKCTVVRSSIKGHINRYKNGKKSKNNKRVVQLTDESSTEFLDSLPEKGNHILGSKFWNKCLTPSTNGGYTLWCTMGGSIECKWKIKGNVKKSELHAAARYGLTATEVVLDGVSSSVDKENFGTSVSYKVKTVKKKSDNVQVGK